MATLSAVSANELTVLGIDLASRSWRDVGSAILSFTSGNEPAWTVCRTNVIAWPNTPLFPEAIAREIDRFVLKTGVSAVSIDGPQGWRDPHAVPRAGVGRLCEYEVRAQGKARLFGMVTPHTFTSWFTFSIAVFHTLLNHSHVVLANDRERFRLEAPPPGHYYLLECLPTSIWRTSGLTPLPGHANASPDIVESCALILRERFELPMTAVTREHDHLQAVVAALPAAALLGGPCEAVPRGEAAHDEPATARTPEHRVEGLIWDARPYGSANIPLSKEDHGSRHRGRTSNGSEASSPMMTEGYSHPPHECMCGCGGRPKGGRFLRGHDAKLKSALLRRIAQGDESARDGLRQLGWERFAPKRE